jgi:heme-degrading monooxygenase HmoA
MPGFVGASVYVSLDGKTVVNYVQWKTREAFDAMFASPAAKEHMRELNAFVVSVSPVRLPEPDHKVGRAGHRGAGIGRWCP